MGVILNLISIFRTITYLFLTPLSFLPSSILIFFNFVIGAFGVFMVGRVLKWLWDALPMV